MRIVAGRWRGLKLAGLGDGDAEAHLRPTSDRVREALFNVLTQGAHGDRVEGARVLDLFAGTGALGLEALSRGAALAVFVDDGAAARALLRTNIEKARAGGIARVFRRDATRLGENRDAPYDLVMLDPPYGQGLGEQALDSARSGGWIAPGATLVCEEGGGIAPPDWTRRLDERRYGGTTVTVLEAT